MIGAGDRLRRMIVFAGLAIAFVWISIWIRFREVEAEPPPTPPDIRAWSYLGCLELAVGDWENGDPEPSVTSTVPQAVMLLPDTFDEWGREYETFRARSLDPEGARDVPYRWFTRADTLWLVWSAPSVRGGIALRETGGSLSGRVGLASGPGAEPLDAQASAWPINCYTRELERSGRSRR